MATWSTEFTRTSREIAVFGWMTSSTEMYSIGCNYQLRLLLRWCRWLFFTVLGLGLRATSLRMARSNAVSSRL
jgi:hypothetical protein